MQAKKPSLEDSQVAHTSAESSLPNTSQRKTSVQTKIEVLRIPADRSCTSKAEVSTIEIPEGLTLNPGTLESGNLSPETLKLEGQLKQVPCIMDFKGALFRWDHRHLVDKLFNDQELSKKKRGRYFMYKCTDPGLGLPKNQTFAKLKCPCIYGDAFIFKLEKQEFSKSGRARYAKMGSARDFVEANMIILGLAIAGGNTATDPSL